MPRDEVLLQKSSSILATMMTPPSRTFHGSLRCEWSYEEDTGTGMDLSVFDLMRHPRCSTQGLRGTWAMRPYLLLLAHSTASTKISDTNLCSVDSAARKDVDSKLLSCARLMPRGKRIASGCYNIWLVTIIAVDKSCDITAIHSLRVHSWEHVSIVSIRCD